MHHSRSEGKTASRPGGGELKTLGSHFRPPRMLFTAIDRPFPLSKIRDGLARQIVVVHAPSGFGKTALLKAGYEAVTSGSDYFQSLFDGGVGHCGWITLDPAHGRPAELLADLCLALGIRAPQPPASLRELFDIVADRESGAILFIDELDIASSPDAQAFLDGFFLTAPDNLRIVCASQQKLPLPLARLRVRGLVTEINAVDLAFGRNEIRSLFPRNINTGDVANFVRATRGWPALTQIALGVMESGGTDERARLLAGEHPDLFRHIEEAILRPLSPALRRTLCVTSILEEFPLELASHLSGTDLQADDLRLLEDMSPLIEKSQTGAAWYRLHPILRKCLTTELAGDPQTDEATLHSMAAIWFAERGFLERAVSHAARAGNFSLAAQTIRQAGGVNLFIRAGHTVLEHLIDDLPAGVIHESPSLSLCYVLVLAKKGHIKAARERMEAIKQGRALHGDEFLTIEASTLHHIDGLVDIYEDLHLDDAQILHLERMASGFSPQSTWELGWIYNHLCIAYTRRGNLDLARLSALKALAYYREEKTAYAQIFMLIHLGLVNTLAGNFSAALTFCREAQDLIQSAQWTDVNLEAICRVATADVLYLQGEIALVERSLGEAVNAVVQGEGWVDIYSRMFSLLARSRLRLSGLDTAMAAIDKAEEVAVERALPRLKIAADIMRVDIFSKTGLIESAVLLAERLVSSLRDPELGRFWTWREESDFLVAQARLLKAQGRPGEGLANLEIVMARSRANGSGYHLLAAEILATVAAWNDGRHAQALEYFQFAIARARSHEVTQLFEDEGLEFSTVVRAIVRRFGLKVFSADAVDFIGRIIGQGEKSAFGKLTDNGRRIKSPLAGGKSLLSQREQQVLLCLHEGKSNKEIARALGLSEPTVKFHLKNVFSKLGVSRRAMALAVSAKLNLR
ncbi:LuxR C-terminal-related transcriptional regulator [Rhizobium leguminosarum]|uniref:helix-turn-helix transcriptional regulator n=1 Tax=Rhizobium leguminosarum TaxID=384 RepID=UPI003F97D31D